MSNQTKNIMQHELRKDYITDNWTILVPARVKRPFGPKKCPFCPENVSSEAGQTILRLNKEGKEKDPWRVLVVENKFPLTHPSKFKLTGLGTLFTKTLAHGYSEVVIETPEHNKRFHDLSTDEINLVFNAFKKRIEKLSERERVEYILITKLEGKYRGSLEHPHSQIITYPKIPKDLTEEIDGFNNYHKRNKSCVFCDVIEKEKKSQRKVMENDHFIGIAPFASSSPYEVWLLPKKHKTTFSELDEFELFSLAEILKKVLTKMNEEIENFSYALVFHERPSKFTTQDFHFHVEVYPTLHSPGFKRHVGIPWNEITPEKAASVLRK